MNGKEVAMVVGKGVLGAGVALVASYGLSKIAALSPMSREVILGAAGLGVMGVLAWKGKPLLGVALGAPMFAAAGGSFACRLQQTTGADLVARLAATAGLNAPAAPGALGPGTPAAAPPRTSPAGLPVYQVGAR